MSPRMSKADLLERFESAITDAGGRVIRSNNTHPFDLSIISPRDMEPHRVRLYIWNVTHGGGSARAPGEYRIQLTGVESPLEAPSGFRVLLMGIHDEVFAAFDPKHHREFSSNSPSIQIPLETLERAQTLGLAGHRRANGETAVAIRDDLLLAYVENQEAIHDMAADQVSLNILEASASKGYVPEDATVELPTERQRVVRQVAGMQRAADFRKRVLRAYEFRCAACGLQLRLPEAAHIVPVPIPGSTDTTSNGLSLCPLHHTAYDTSLLGIMENYEMRVSAHKIEELLDAGLAEGEEAFRAAPLPKILLPVNSSDRPDPTYLAQGLAARGWAA